MPSAPFFLALAIALVLLNAFFVAAEFSLVRVRATRIAELAQEGDWRARAAEATLRRLDAFLSATQLGITCTSLGLGWIGEPAFAGLVAPVFAAIGVSSPSAIRSASVVMAFVVITFLHIVLGELAPKSYAIRATEQVALWTALPMRLFQLVFAPALWLLARAAAGTLRLLGVPSEGGGDAAHSEEELRLVVAESHRMGTLSKQKRELLENVIDYTERTARHVMIPRADVAYLSLARSLEENFAVITQTAHTRFPLASSDIDHVIGLIHVKDLFLRRDALKTPQDLVPIKREILFVPETRPLDALQREFQQSRTHMAMVVDEYGGTAGMLTLEDIIEEIVGEIQDEFDREPPKIVETPQGLVFDGLSLIEDVSDRLGVPIEPPQDVSTLGGLIGERLGRIPRAGDRVPIDDYDLTVTEMNGRRVTRVLAVRRPIPAAGTA
jgi:CBS domain containing-hemolysin-like protein